MNRARVRLFLLLALSGILTAVAASLFLGMAFALLTEGPMALLGGLRLGVWAIWFGLAVAALPAILFGGLLWLRGVRRAIIWAGTGLLGGLVCLGISYVGPGDVDQITQRVLEHYPLAFPAAFAIGGALAALTFLGLMRLFVRVFRPRSSIRPV